MRPERCDGTGIIGSDTPLVKQRSIRKISRRELYDLVWECPMWKVATEFGLSGNGLAKLCRREGIPVPERGYWTKFAHGKRVKKPKLPAALNGQEALNIEATPTNRTALEDSMPEPLAALLRAEREASEPIAIPKSPKPHSFVEMWPKAIAEGEARRRRIASIFFREVERRGGTIAKDRWHEHDPHRFSITLLGATINVTFQKRFKMVKIPPDPKQAYSYERTEYVSTGLLRLRFENYFNVPIRREWNETEEKRLDGRLREIMIALYFAVEAQRLRDEDDRREAARRALQERRRWELAERERREREAVQVLLAEAKAWEDARRIRGYVKARTERGVKDADWSEWALSVADLLDPAETEA